MTLDDLRRLKQEREATDLTLRKALKQAHESGYSLRQIGEAIGVSHQTVANLIESLDR